MIKKLKRKYKGRGFKTIVENFVSLSALNILNYIFPLILIPYLTRVLGVENYGIYAFVYAILNYFTLVVRYGFEFSATKQIAIISEQKQKLNEVFSAVLSVRVILILITLVILNLLFLFIPKIADYKTYFIMGAGIFIGHGLIPVWFFQGMEKMKFLTIINLVTRSVSTILVFLFVKKSSQIDHALLFQSVGLVIGGILSIILAISIFKLRFIFPQKSEVKFQLKDGWQVFLSTLGMNFYRESNTIILGFLTNFTAVGYYSAAEKIVKAVQSLVAPFVNTLFPHFGRRLNAGANLSVELKRFVSVGKYYSLVLLVISSVLFLFSPLIIRYYLDESYLNSILNVQIMSAVIIFGGLNFYFGIAGLVNLGLEKYFTKAVWISAILSVVVCFILIPYWNDKAAAVAMVLAELSLSLLILIKVYKIYKIRSL